MEECTQNIKKVRECAPVCEREHVGSISLSAGEPVTVNKHECE